jgi:hypothetical protein
MKITLDSLTITPITEQHPNGSGLEVQVGSRVHMVVAGIEFTACLRLENLARFCERIRQDALEVKIPQKSVPDFIIDWQHAIGVGIDPEVIAMQFEMDRVPSGEDFSQICQMIGTITDLHRGVICQNPHFALEGDCILRGTSICYLHVTCLNTDVNLQPIAIRLAEAVKNYYVNR